MQKHFFENEGSSGYYSLYKFDSHWIKITFFGYFSRVKVKGHQPHQLRFVKRVDLCLHSNVTNFHTCSIMYCKVIAYYIIVHQYGHL